MDDYRRRSRGSRRQRNVTLDKSQVDYKKPELLRAYMTEHGRIKPRRQTGLDAKSQRYIAREIKRARHLALLPFVSD
ncbi:MAG: 30S ribosomal protein S18 [Anaerolineae bacterium]|nr:30S ribosomal protein S18 [Anaerolineae bacterium]MCO5190438.1 30S ribosomal protein S18 [Anaerolineae bacterium]MCO5193216.1 30S ribosomal protein S18 [Anaerolineae bacterium]MCO5198160.1 30S ribosomal protein S18 [Anaerolineae bacterium]MCO5205467.1 30S ribosomal protein S18 [Anaerolineae bacterium]